MSIQIYTYDLTSLQMNVKLYFFQLMHTHIYIDIFIYIYICSKHLKSHLRSLWTTTHPFAKKKMLPLPISRTPSTLLQHLLLVRNKHDFVIVIYICLIVLISLHSVRGGMLRMSSDTLSILNIIFVCLLLLVFYYAS